jgi:uncharacterized membrane protein
MLELFDFVAVAGSLVSLLAYHLYSYVTVFCCESRSIQLTRNMMNGLIWIAKHKTKSDPASVTLAVQTLRNTMLVAIFIGGSSLQFGVSYLNSYGSDTRTYMQVRTVILAAFLMCSFLCWASVIRGASHLGYLIGTPIGAERDQLLEQQHKLEEEATGGNTSPSSLYAKDKSAQGIIDLEATGSAENSDTSEALPANTVAESRAMIKLMMISFSLGFRFLFVSIPYWFYAAGPVALIISTICVLGFLYNLDHLEIKRRSSGPLAARSLTLRVPSPLAGLRESIAASRGYQNVSVPTV